MITRPDHLLTLEEWEALPEDNSRHFELQEGVLIGSPKAPFRHQQALLDIMIQLHQQLPLELAVVGGVEVVIQPEFPATVRVPDAVVFRKGLISPNLPRFVADQVLVAVEVIAPGSRATDTLAKPADYAEAGIPYYWVVDPDDGPSLTAYHRAGDRRYQKEPAVNDRFETTEPFSVRIELTGRDYQ